MPICSMYIFTDGPNWVQFLRTRYIGCAKCEYSITLLGIGFLLSATIFI